MYVITRQFTVPDEHVEIAVCGEIEKSSVNNQKRFAVLNIELAGDQPSFIAGIRGKDEAFIF